MFHWFLAIEKEKPFYLMESFFENCVSQCPAAKLFHTKNTACQH
jgi:hypothetical protein